MSDIDQDDLKREYLPLVNNVNNSDGSQMMNPKVNNQSILSVDKSKSGKYQEVQMEQQTFYQKNKKVINIALIILLVVGVVLAIVLPLTLGGGSHDNPIPPRPEPTEPDPYQYQEFNPFYVDPANPP